MNERSDGILISKGGRASSILLSISSVSLSSSIHLTSSPLFVALCSLSLSLWELLVRLLPPSRIVTSWALWILKHLLEKSKIPLFLPHSFHLSLKLKPKVWTTLKNTFGISDSVNFFPYRPSSDSLCFWGTLILIDVCFYCGSVVGGFFSERVLDLHFLDEDQSKMLEIDSKIRSNVCSCKYLRARLLTFSIKWEPLESRFLANLCLT